MSEKFKKELIEWIKVIATALVFAFIITQFIRPTLVRGKSMYPTLVENDYLIINRMAYKIGEQNDGDLIVFKTNLLQDDGKPKDLSLIHIFLFLYFIHLIVLFKHYNNIKR